MSCHKIVSCCQFDQILLCLVLSESFNLSELELSGLDETIIAVSLSMLMNLSFYLKEGKYLIMYIDNDMFCYGVFFPLHFGIWTRCSCLVISKI